MNFETTYERDDRDTDRDNDYRCFHCGEMTGGSVCNDCTRLREKHTSDVESGLIAATAIAQEALDARWDDDTTNVRRKLAADLRKEMATAFFIATGERL